MNANHYDELSNLSQKIYDQATDSITNYITAKYCAVGNDTTREQLEDYMFIVQETSAFLLGNALALLASSKSPVTQAPAPTFTLQYENLSTIVSIQDAAPLPEIFYTLDGSDPTEKTQKYSPAETGNTFSSKMEL